MPEGSGRKRVVGLIAAAAVVATGATAAVMTLGAADAIVPAPVTPSPFSVINATVRPAHGQPVPASGTEASLWGNASVATTTISGSGRVIVGAIGDFCEGWPTVEVLVNGKRAGATTVVSNTQYGAYGIGSVAKSSFPQGTYRVQIRLVNDVMTASCDRNAHIGFARMENPSVAPTATAAPTASTPPTATPKPTTPSTPPGSAFGDLDPTGRQIPDTNYAIGAGAVFLATNGADSNPGTQASPVRTLNKAIALTKAGGTLVVRGGTYRDAYETNNLANIVTKSMTIQAFPHEQVWFDGTDVIASTAFAQSGGTWSMTWSTPHFCRGGYYKFAYNAQPTNNAGPCGHYDIANNNPNKAVADPQMVFIDGQQQKEVASLGEVRAGTFFYRQDLAGKTGKIFLGTNPAGKRVELAKRQTALILAGKGNRYAVKGIGFRRYATAEHESQFAALQVNADNSLIENSVFTEMAAGAFSLGARGGVLRHSALVRNGNVGFGTNGHSEGDGQRDGLLIEGNLISGNNTENFGVNCSRSCGHAGIKLAHMVGFTVRNNIFETTQGGSGFWCDEECSDGVIVNNLVRGNGGAGIFYEVSDTAIIASNMVIGNKVGIRVASSNTKIYNNTMVDNSLHSLWVYDDSRNANDKRGSDIGPDTRNVEVKNNIFSGVNVNMVMASRGSSAALNTGPNTFFSGLDYNSYYRPGDKVMVRWIDGSDQSFRTLAPLQAKGWEKHGQSVLGGPDPFLTNRTSASPDLAANSPARGSGVALPADVAKAIGVSTSAGLNRGAITYAGK